MKELFVFGAGASYASGGAPLGKDLGWRYFHDCCGFRECKEGTLTPTDADREEKTRQYSIWIRFLSCVQDHFPEAIEPKGVREKAIEVLSSIESDAVPSYLPKQYYIDEILKEFQEKADTECARIVKQLIFAHIAETTKSHNRLYDTFLEAKLKDKSIDDIAIISFNFDTLLSRNEGEETYFDYRIDFSDIDHHRGYYKYNKSRSFPLLKLHGSIDWQFCPKCKTINLDFPHHRWNYTDRPCKDKNCDGVLEPLIITPYEKQNDKGIESLWREAEESLREAEKITIIGYSFPEYDTEVMDLFKKMDSNVKLKVIDFCEKKEEYSAKLTEVEQKYKRIFTHIKKDMEISLDGFENYLKDNDKPGGRKEKVRSQGYG